MKRIKYLFFLCIMLIMYLIIAPIYLQFEVNGQFNATSSYQIDNFKGENVAKGYAVLKKTGEESNTFYVVRPNTKEKVDLYQIRYLFNSSSKEQSNKQKFEKKLVLEDKKSNLETFIQSNGYFFTDVNNKQLGTEFSNAGLKVKQIKNLYYNPLSRYLKTNFFIICILILFTFIINIILTIGNCKQAALLSLHGRKRSSIMLLFLKEYLISLLKSSFLFFIAFSFLHFVVAKNSLTINFFFFYGMANLLLIIGSIFLYFISFPILSTVNISETLKNRNYSKFIYLLLLGIQVSIILAMPLIFSKTLNYYYQVKEVKENIRLLDQLNGYYTFSGVNANYYDSLSSEEILQYEQKFQNLYEDNASRSFFFNPQFIMYLNTNNPNQFEQTPWQNVVYMDQNYYDNMADFSIDMDKSSKEDNDRVSVLIPNQFKEQAPQIVANLGFELEHTNVKYIENNIKIQFFDYSNEYESSDVVKQAKGYKKLGINNVIVILNPKNVPSFAPVPVPCLENFATSNIFLRVDSLSTMIALTEKYQLDKLVTPESKLDKYLESLHQLEYEYNIALSTLILSLCATAVLSVTTSEVVMNVKRKHISVAYLHGKKIGYTLKNIFIIYLIFSLLSLILVFFFAKIDVAVICFTLLMLVLIIGYLISRYQYFIKYKLSQLLKGE